MKTGSTTAVRVALLAVAAAIAMATATAAEVEKKPAESQAEIEKKLEDARRRLDTAAREVAQLSMSMSEHTMPAIRHFGAFGPPRAMLGINLGPRGEELSEGVAIVSVSPGGAAESAGLKAGDVLLIGWRQATQARWRYDGARCAHESNGRSEAGREGGTALSPRQKGRDRNRGGASTRPYVHHGDAGPRQVRDCAGISHGAVGRDACRGCLRFD